MNEVTPDLIAEIATRLLNDTPHSAGAQSSVPHLSAYQSNLPHEAVSQPSVPYPAVPYPSVPNSTVPPRSGAYAAVPDATGGYPSAPYSSASAESLASSSYGGRSNAPYEQFHTGNSGFPGTQLPSSAGIPQRGGLSTPGLNAPGLGTPGIGSPGLGAFSAERYGPTEVQSHAPHLLSNQLHTGTAAGSTPHEVADVSPDGLRNFVNQIRNPTSEAEAGFCPGSPGVSFLQQIFKPQSIPQPTLSGNARPFDVPSIRRDFPALHQRVHGKPLVWFDNAATTQKPQQVIDAISRYYAHDNSNIHRAAHSLAARSTDAFEAVREKVQKFLGAASSKEIIFVRGTTEGVNLISQTYGKKFLQPGDEILMSTLEHHANIVPWQMVAKEKGAVLRVIPVNDRGEVMLEEYQALLGPKTKIVALTQASNSLGTILPVTEMTQMAKRYGARVLIDGAQSVSHIPVNVQEIGCDFFVFSGHKIFGPTGIGTVFAREELQEIMPPWQGGGNMIKNVTFEETSYSDPPNKFEAGTPNIADTVGLGAALDYVQSLGLQNIGKYEHHLLHYATERLLPIDGLRIIGQAREKVSVISFVLKDFRTEDVGKLLDQEGIAVRAGHHCSQPSLRRYGLDATVRPSFAFYNTTEEIDHLVSSIKRISSRSVNFSQSNYGSHGPGARR